VADALAEEPDGARPPVYSGTWQAKADRSAPQLTLSGDLYTHGFDETGRDIALLHVDAQDGVPGGTNSQRRSGVRSIRFLVGNVEVARADQDSSCGPDSCPLTFDHELDSDDYAERSHTLKVIAEDYAGNSSSSTWQINIPRDATYAARVAQWQADVEARVDAALPVVPLTDRMPAPPERWRDPAGCMASDAALRECFDASQVWGRDVQQWLHANGGVLIDGEALPVFPLFVYALEPGLQLDLSAATSGAWELAKRAGTRSSTNLGLEIYFHEPVTPVAISSLARALDLRQFTGIRGVFDPRSAGIAGELVDVAPVAFTDLSERFYVAQQEIAGETVADINETLGDSDPEEAGEVEELELLRGQAQAMSAHLVARGGFITAVRTSVALGALPEATLATLLDTLVRAEAGVKSVQLAPLTSFGPDESLNAVSTDAELLGARDAGVQMAGTARSSDPPGAPAQTSSVEDAPGRVTCDRDNIPNNDDRLRYAPNHQPRRWEMRVFVTGTSDDQGRFPKRSEIWNRWTVNGSLGWFCGDNDGERGFEPESKPFAFDPRWSTNWDADGNIQSNLPLWYQDDLAVGGFQAEFSRPSKYPDFAVGTFHARQLKYRKLYYAKFTTNRGASNEGNVNAGKAVIRGQQTTGPFLRGHGTYCRTRSAAGKGRNDRYCSFGRDPFCIDHIPLSTVKVRSRVNWSAQSGPTDRCHHQQGYGD
jgi:hypothetical protein